MPVPTSATLDPRQVREGLSVDVVDEVKRLLELSDLQVATATGLSARTLGRRRHEGRLAPDESDRVARIARLLGLALEAFGHDEEAVQAWFKTPHALLQDETPLDHADTEPGARAVEDLLNAIRYGFAA